MIGGKINLGQLKHVVQKKKGQSGEIECLVIPIEQNHIFKGKDGNMYLDIIAFEVKNPAEGQKDTHIVKQSLPKEVMEKMSEEEKKAMPIIGNLNTKIGGGSQTPNNPNPGVTLEENEDLPF